MSTAAEVERIFTDGLNPEIRAVLWDRAQRIITEPTFTDVERDYARQLADLLDAIDLDGDIPTEIKKLTWGALAWALTLMEVIIEVDNETAES